MNSQWGIVLSLELDEDIMTVAMSFAEGGVQQIDISDPQNITQLGQHMAPWDVLALQADTNYLYTSTSAGLWIYDMADEVSPVLMNFYNQWEFMRKLFLQGNRLFAIDNNSLHIIDVSNPNNFTELGIYEVANRQLREVHVKGDFAYLLINDNSEQLEILDVTDPANPVKTGNTQIGGVGRDIFVDPEKGLASLVYWNSDQDRGFQLFDVSNPALPSHVTTMQTPGTPMAIETLEDTLFVCSITGDQPNMNWNLQAYNISNPAAPDLMDVLSGAGEMWDLQVENGVISASITGASIYLIEWYTHFFVIIDICPSDKSRQHATTTGGNGVGYTASVDGYGNYNYNGEKDITGDYGIVVQTTIIPPPIKKQCCMLPKVTPTIAGTQFACKTLPGSCVIGECGTATIVTAVEDPAWEFTHWSGAATGTAKTNSAGINGMAGCPLCSDNIAYAHFSPWLEMSGANSVDICPPEEEINVEVMDFSMEASLADDWTVASISVEISGDEDLSKYIKKVKLIGSAEAEVQHSGNGTINFLTPGLTIGAGAVATFTLELTFDKATDLDCPSEPKDIRIEIEE